MFDNDKGLCGDLEFDIEFTALNSGIEATVNWESEEIDNDGVFYTDSNGLEFIKRVRKYGKDIEEVKSLMPNNMYPINSGIFIENKDKT